MPIDHKPNPTATTSRRAFITRTAAGGAVVATATTTGLGGLGIGLNAAAAQPSPATDQNAQQFGVDTAPLEMAANVAYQAGLNNEGLTSEVEAVLRLFQRHHQEVAGVLTALIVDSDVPAPVADPGVIAQFSPPAEADEQSVLALLAALEEGLAATHLARIGSIDDPSLAKTVAQVTAVEQQQAVSLGRASGASIEALTPRVADTEGILEAGATPTPVETTVTEPDATQDGGVTSSTEAGAGDETTTSAAESPDAESTTTTTEAE